MKKWLEYQQPLDEINLLEEVGDCLWRLAQVCEAIGVTLGDAMEANLRKLEVRYPNGPCNPAEAAESARDRAKERVAVISSGSQCRCCEDPNPSQIRVEIKGAE